MLTREEKEFIRYWAAQRLQKKRYVRKLSIGMPLGALVAILVLVNLLSGWYRRATAELNSSSSLIVVILVAMAGIVVFFTIMGAQHRWDRNESAYQALLQQQEKEDGEGMQRVDPESGLNN
jgi:membrane-associated HD superfamily phosphohydrolase